MIDLHAGDLSAYLALLDSEIKKINSEIAWARDSDSDGLCDRGEYLIGTGLVAIQHYLTSVRCLAGAKPNVAYVTGPFVYDGVSYASAINAGANCWKHQDEWFETLFSTQEIGPKDKSLDTLGKLEKVTPWGDYTCSNLVAVLLNGKALELSALLPHVFEWRDNLTTKF